uniref:Carbonic anhydrase n=1 Tax=Cuerna arida TaxID=1464854 RepID=A0A1B6FP36_9HEMI
MTLSDSINENISQNKILIHEAAKKDGKLFSPIDLSLGITKPLYLDRLEWMNLGTLPSIMKMTNTGQTVVINAQWSSSQPYLASGPLDDSYIFSQIHFHWGAGEHEGSEHSIDGTCYPLEIHAVFYKSQYLTPDVALQKDDGTVVIVYLCKLRDQSSPGFKWLSPYLDQVVEPKVSTLLALVPLSSLLIPFTLDYILYWGSLTVSDCSHVMLWLISRVALGISLEDLNKFRKLLCSRKEALNKNCLAVNSTQDRTVFHVNPSLETKDFLLPGIVEPRTQLFDCEPSDGYTQMTVLNQKQADQIFRKKCSKKEDLKNAPIEANKITNVMGIKSHKFDFSNVLNLENAEELQKSISRNNSYLSLSSSGKESDTSPVRNFKTTITDQNVNVEEIIPSLTKLDLYNCCNNEKSEEMHKTFIRKKSDLCLSRSLKANDISPTRIPVSKTRSGDLKEEKLKHTNFKMTGKRELVKPRIKKWC